MPSFIDASQCSDHPAHVRDGYLTLFVYLPVSFGNDFITYIADIIPPILKVCHYIATSVICALFSVRLFES